MSFSSIVKEELVGVKLGSHGEKLALLCGLTHTSAAVTLGRRGMGIEYVSENEHVAELAKNLTAELYGLENSTAERRQEGLKKSNFVVRVQGKGCRALLMDCGNLPQNDEE